MDVKIHSYGEWHPTQKGKTPHVIDDPAFKLTKDAGGQLRLEITLENEGAKGRVGRIQKVATVVMEHDELKKLSLLIHNALFQKRRPTRRST